MPRIAISGLCRQFPPTRRHQAVAALGPLDAVIDHASFTAVIGPSGCGKSTLLRLLAGLDRPSAGSVSIAGRIVDGPAPSRAMVFQQPALFPWLTVAANVGFALGGLPSGARAERVGALLHAVGLDGFAEHYPATLSGGMQQRAALARALATDPEVLLLDEPFGALDQQSRSLMQEMLAALWERDRKTVALVTHDIDEALYLADRVVVLGGRPGTVRADIPVPFERPRAYTLRTDPDFTRMKAALTDLLRPAGAQLTEGDAA